MENAVETNHRVRFKAFELDLHTRELYRNGVRLRVQGQPIDVLEMLLERPGELVTREALRKKLWPEDTFVDFEHSLNSAVTRLRDVLGDRAEDPKYIETLPRLGYRFICRMENGETPGAAAISSAHGVEMTAASAEGTGAASSAIRSETKPSFVRRWRWPLMVSAAGVAITAGAFLWYVHQPLPPPHIDGIRPITQDLRWRWKGALGVDGARVFFRGAPRGFFAVGSSGEIETIPVDLPWPSDQQLWAGDVSPDGSYFLGSPSSGQTALWVFTTTGKPVRYIGSGEGAGAVWSPDSKQVLYWTTDGKAYTVPTTFGEPRLLFTSNTGGGGFFAWSSDGKRIRFTRGNTIWEIASDGSNLREFLPGMKDSVAKCCGRWTPDGDFYIFASTNRKQVPYPWPGSSQLWALDERSGRLRKPNRDPVQLTFEPMHWNFPVISQDSRTIFATGTVRQGELVGFDTQTGQSFRYLSGISADWLTFSPDGKYVAYVSYPERKVWRANRDGSGRILLAEPEKGAWGLRWSPDGRKILFVVSANPIADPSEIYTVSPEGGTPERVQLPPGENPFDPTWSPDSKHLAYNIDRSYPNVTSNGIRILDLETHRSTALPTAPVPVFGARWSPDGRYLFCGAEPNSGSVFFDFEKQKWTYFPLKIDWTFGNWAHDSRSVYVLGAKVSLSFDGVYRVSLPSGHVERVIDLTKVRLAGSTIGYWLGLDPEDHPLILRDAGSIELYALTLER